MTGPKSGSITAVGPGHPSLRGAPKTFGPLVLGHSFLSPSHKFQYFTRPLSENPTDDADGTALRAATYDEWRHLVVPMYAQRKLTFSRDRLPALSGLATAAARRCNDAYVAGLCKEDFQLGLLWSVDGDPSAAPSEYLAPSFSFASVKRPVVYNLPNRLSESGDRVYRGTGLELLAVDLVWGRDPFGMVLGGSVLLSGPSRKACLNSKSSKSGDDDASTPSAKEPGAKGTWKYYWDTELAAVPLPDREGGQSTSRLTLNRSETGLSIIDVELEMYMLMVADVACFTEDGGPRVEGAALILAPSAAEEGAYQRLGLAITSHAPEARENWLQTSKVREFRIV